jgi:hypothetical protein
MGPPALVTSPLELTKMSPEDLNWIFADVEVVLNALRTLMVPPFTETGPEIV